MALGLDLDQPVNYSSGMTQVHDTKRRLLDTARELFYARSYEDSKRDLTVAMLDDSWQQFQATLLADAFAADIPPLQRLQRLLDMQYRHHVAVKEKTGHVYGCPFGNLAGEMSTQDEVIRERLKHIFSDLQAPIQNILDEAVVTGDLPELDTHTTASAMVAYLEGLSLMAKTHNDPDVLRRLGPAMLGLAVPAGQG